VIKYRNLFKVLFANYFMDLETIGGHVFLPKGCFCKPRKDTEQAMKEYLDWCRKITLAGAVRTIKSYDCRKYLTWKALAEQGNFEQIPKFIHTHSASGRCMYLSPRATLRRAHEEGIPFP